MLSLDDVSNSRRFAAPHAWNRCAASELGTCATTVALALGLGAGLWVTPQLARAQDPVAAQRLEGVAREVRIEIVVPPRAAFAPAAEGLPGGRAVEALLPIRPEQLADALDRYPGEMTVTTTPVRGGVLARFAHPRRDLRWSSARRGDRWILRLGPESEESRLRNLAEALRAPIPAPQDLGAQLELWHEAEKAMAAGELELALKLWEKLGEDASLRDLAQLRSAEVFVLSGHVEEALFQLREVSREHPRSTGAALARLTALHLEAITGEGDPTAAQVVIAATSGSRNRFHAFTWLRAAEVLRELDRAELALHHLPRPEQLPDAGTEAQAREVRNRLVEATIGHAAAAEDPIALIAQYDAWEQARREHPDAARLDRLAARAYARLGLYHQAVALLREQLSHEQPAALEAQAVDALARAYYGLDELEHLRAVVGYLLDHHVDAPGLDDRLRQLLLAEHRAGGIEQAWSQAERSLGRTTAPELRRALLAAQIDLAQAYGTPAQALAALERLARIGFDDEDLRAPQLAVALARAGRDAEAEPRLRAWIARVTDPERRDEMAYVLAEVEMRRGQADDADAILRAIARHETRWGRVARARLRELALEQIVGTLERSNALALGAGKNAP